MTTRACGPEGDWRDWEDWDGCPDCGATDEDIDSFGYCADEESCGWRCTFNQGFAEGMVWGAAIIAMAEAIRSTHGHTCEACPGCGHAKSARFWDHLPDDLYTCRDCVFTKEWP